MDATASTASTCYRASARPRHAFNGPTWPAASKKFTSLGSPGRLTQGRGVTRC